MRKQLSSVAIAFPLGLYYARNVRELPQGALAEVANLDLEPDRAIISKGSILINTAAWGSGTRIVGLHRLRFANGLYLIVAFTDIGEIVTAYGRDPATGQTTEGFTVPLADFVDAASYGDATWFATGVSRPIRHDSLKASDRFDWAGCEPPPSRATLDGVTGVVSRWQTGGLEVGRRYYAVRYRHGRDGQWGISGLGENGMVYVGSDLDGTAQVTVSVPAAETGERYEGVTSRQLMRTMADDQFNGPYYHIADIAGTDAATYIDRYPDTALSGSVIAPAYLADDLKIPPAARYILWNDNVMVYGGTAANPLRFWWSEPFAPDLVPFNQASDVPAPATDALTGLARVAGAVALFTQSTISIAQIAGTEASIQRAEATAGCIAPRSLKTYHGLAIYLSAEGPMIFDGMTARPLGGTAGVSMGRLLRDYCERAEHAAGAVFEGRYYLAYADSRDNPAARDNTRVLIYDFTAETWTMRTGIHAGIFAVDQERLLYSEARTYSRVLQLGIGDTDYDMAAGAAQTITAFLKTGDVLAGLPGQFHRLSDWRVGAVVPAGSLTLTVLVDGSSAGTGSITQASTMTYGKAKASITGAALVPELYRGRGPAVIGRTAQLMIANSGNKGQWSVQEMSLDAIGGT